LSPEGGARAQDGQVRKTVPYVAAWFVAGMAAVALASLGVSVVSRQVTGSRPAPLTAEQIRDELATGAAGAGDGAATTSSTTPDGPTTTAVPRTSSTAAGGTSPTTTSGPGAPGGVTSTTTTSSPPAPPAATTRTYPLVGGTATLRFSADGVDVVVATPNAGYSVEFSDTHSNGVRVEFDSDGHRSRVEGWWDGGPQDEVREED
jgi:hypothetical protein